MFTEEQLMIIKNCKDVYLKLLYLIKYMCKNQDNNNLMYQIYRNTYKFYSLDKKCTYLLYCYFEYSTYCYFEYSIYADLGIINYIEIPNEVLKKRIGFDVDLEVSKIFNDELDNTYQYKI